MNQLICLALSEICTTNFARLIAISLYICRPLLYYTNKIKKFIYLWNVELIYVHFNTNSFRCKMCKEQRF